MNNKLMKIIVILTITILLLTALQIIAFAAGPGGGANGGGFGGGSHAGVEGPSGGSGDGTYTGINTNVMIGGTNAAESSKAITARILGTFQLLGSIVSIIALIIIGMRYMFSSVEEKAQMKGVIGYYIAGCILVFATSNVLSIAWNVLDGIEHNWLEVSKTDATCVTEGETYYECQDEWCSATRTVKIARNNNHDWSDASNDEILKYETCSTEGKINKKCDRTGCDATQEDSIPVRDYHNNFEYSFSNYIVEPTCTTSGKALYVCNRNNSHTEERDVAQLGHTYNVFVEKVDGNCTELGSETYKCERCDKTSTHETPGTGRGHSFNWKTIDESIVPTCTIAALRQQICSRCHEIGETEEKTDPNNHDGEIKKWWESVDNFGCEEFMQCENCKWYKKINGTWSSEKTGSGNTGIHVAGEVFTRRRNNNMTHTDMHHCTRCGDEIEGETYGCAMEPTGNQKADPDNHWNLFNADQIFEHKCSWCGYIRWREHKNSGAWK